MKTSTQFIDSLRRINFVKLEDNKFIADNGFALSYSIKLNAQWGLPSAQIIARVFYKESLVTNWGFEDEASQLEFVKLWKQIESQVRQIEMHQHDENASIGRALFERFTEEF